MIPHKFYIFILRVTPSYLIAVATTNILAKNESSPHTNPQSFISIRPLLTIHAYYVQLLLLCTAFIRVIKLAYQVTIPYPEITPKTNEDLHNNPPANSPLSPGNK